MENPDHNNESGSNPKRTRIEVDVANLPADPGLRIKISTIILMKEIKLEGIIYKINLVNQLTMIFHKVNLAKQSVDLIQCGSKNFKVGWNIALPKMLHIVYIVIYFDLILVIKEGETHLLLKDLEIGKKKEKLQNHVGDHNSAHNIPQRKCEALLNQRQSIQTVINKQSDVEKREYRTHLNASVDCICFLQRQGLAFRGHDESKDSNNQGNFLELLRFLANHNEEIDKAVLENAPENHQMTSPDIQKEIANAAAVETINAIIKDIGDSLFAIIVDESRDMSTKEQMAIALRYVDKLGHVNERFLGITHVNNTSAVTLKSAIEEVFNKHSLSISRLRGQGYDGASNMRGELNGLKTLILKDNPSTYYVHFFAHKLQLTLVAVVKNHIQIATFFNLVANVMLKL